MNAHETCTISDTTEAVLNGWDLREQSIPSTMDRLKWKMQKELSDTRLQWDLNAIAA